MPEIKYTFFNNMLLEVYETYTKEELLDYIRYNPERKLKNNYFKNYKNLKIKEVHPEYESSNSVYALTSLAFDSSERIKIHVLTTSNYNIRHAQNSYYVNIDNPFTLFTNYRDLINYITSMYYIHQWDLSFMDIELIK